MKKKEASFEIFFLETLIVRISDFFFGKTAYPVKNNELPLVGEYKDQL